MGMDFAASICWYTAWEAACNFIWIIVDIKKSLLSFVPHIDSEEHIQLLFDTTLGYYFIP